MLACTLGEAADGALGDAILEVGIYATEGKRVINLGVDVLQVTVVVDEDGSAAIALLGYFL